MEHHVCWEYKKIDNKALYVIVIIIIIITTTTITVSIIYLDRFTICTKQDW
jgi:hypothetical protein